MVSSPGQEWDCAVHISFETSRRIWARSIIAEPRWLIKLAWRMAWSDFKHMIKGDPSRSLQTISEWEEEHER